MDKLLLKDITKNISNICKQNFDEENVYNRFKHYECLVCFVDTCKNISHNEKDSTSLEIRFNYSRRKYNEDKLFKNHIFSRIKITLPLVEEYLNTLNLFNSKISFDENQEHTHRNVADNSINAYCNIMSKDMFYTTDTPDKNIVDEYIIKYRDNKVLFPSFITTKNNSQAYCTDTLRELIYGAVQKVPAYILDSNEMDIKKITCGYKDFSLQEHMYLYYNDYCVGHITVCEQYRKQGYSIDWEACKKAIEKKEFYKKYPVK